MIRKLLRPLYRWTHDRLNDSAGRWPGMPATFQGRTIGRGHISDEHLAHPELDDAMSQEFVKMGLVVEDFTIEAKGFRDWLAASSYPTDYYGGGKDPEQNFLEKALEHYVSTQFFEVNKASTFIDMAACTSPFADLIAARYGAQTYRQDLVYPKGVNGRQIGGWAHELSLPDASVDAVTLHCSLEHFEGNSDTFFFQELERVLRPGGRAVVLPFYLGYRYTIHVDPAYNLLKAHRPILDPKASLRYCDWYQYFSRHYDPQALQERILDAAPSLQLTLYRVRNFQEIHAESYLRWVGVFEKRDF